MSLPLLLALLGVAAGAAFLRLPSEQERAVRHLPTPRGSKLLLTLSIMRTHGRRMYDWLLENSVRFDAKPWRLQVLGRPVTVVVSSVEAVEDILKTQFDVFVKGPYTTDVLADVLGQGIFAVDGELWAHQRKTASHLFSLQMMRETMEQAVRAHCALLCARLRDVAAAPDGAEPTTVELKRLLDLFTMDVFTKIGFGVDVGGLSGGSDNAQFLDAFERSSLALLLRFQQPMWLWRLKKWLNVGVERQLQRDMRVINDRIHGIIAQSIRDRQRGDAAARRDLVGLFLDKPLPSSTGGSGAPDAELIRDMAVSFIAAGRDTTSQSMAWFLLMMNRYPAVLQRVRDELDAAALPLRDEEDGERDYVPTMADIDKLPFLEAAIRESIRLNPVVAVTTRMAARDTTLVDGTFLKAGTRVVFSNYAMARLPSVWGTDAREYKPDRWLDATTGKLVQVSPFQFPAFLAGPRTCLGMKFALMEMKITLAALLRRFELRTVRDPFAFTYRASVTMGVKGPLDVRVSVRA